MNAYRPLVADSLEQRLFDQILESEADLRKSGNELLLLQASGKMREAHSLDSEKMQPVFEKLQDINFQLSEHVTHRDEAVSKQLGVSIDRLENHANIISCIIAGLVLILGILLGITIRVITKRKKLLAASESRYRSFLERTNEIVVVLSPVGKILSANRKLKKLVGYSDQELAQMTIFELMDEGAVDSFKRMFLVQGRDGAITKVFWVLKSKDGNKIYIKGNITWEFNGEKLERITGFFNDVTQKELLRISLQESEEKFRHLFDKAPIPMYAFDPATLYFVQVNEAALSHYGYTREAFLNLTILDIRPQDEVSRTLPV